MARCWQYYVVGGSADRDRTIASAFDGDHELVRTIPGRGVEQTLVGDAGWREHDTLARITYRGDDAWEFEVSLDEARALVDRWQALGRLVVPAAADERLPTALDARLAGYEDAARRQQVLRDDCALDARTQQRVRELLDPAGAHFTVAWVEAQGAVVVPVPRGPLLSQDDDSRRCHAAFTLVGEDELHAAIRRPDLLPRSADTPDGVSCPNDPDWIVALGGLYLAQTEMALTGPARAAALFWTFDYGLVAGPPVFVEAVLGCSIGEALDRFRAYARHELPIEPAVDVAEVATRYAPV